MKTLRMLVIVLAAGMLPGMAQQRGGRGPAPPPELTTEQKSQYESKIAEIDSMVKGFRAKNVNEDLIADVDVYAKAGKWLLEFPQGFGNAQGITNYLGVLDQGIERGRQLQEGKSPWVIEKGRKVLGYYSDLDGSVQPMGVTVPDGYDAAKPDRLYVWLHGRSNTLTEASFISGIRNAPQFPSTAYTADVGQLTLDCYGRGNNANHQAGEVDIFEGIAAMKRRFKIDPERVLLRGFSLGGAAAWHIALQYPDRWAAAEVGAGTYPGRLMYAATPFPPYQNGPLHIYENILDWALNAYNLPLAGHDGDNDNQVATVGAGRGAAPTPNRGQLESSLRVRAQLAKEGFPSEGAEGDWTVKGTRDIFLISANTQHGVNREVKTKLDAFLKEYGDRGRQDPDHIKFLTYTTRYGQCFWVSLDGLEHHYERAEVDAERSNGGKQYQITTKNLTRLTLRETTKAASIRIDGQDLKVKAAPEIVLERSGSAWKAVKPGRWAGLHKTHGLSGPIDDAFLDPYLLVRPTGTPWNEAANQHALRILEHFDHVYAMNYRAHPRIKDDRDVTEADFAKYNVALFGDPGSNKWIGKVEAKLPLKWTKETIAIGDQSFPAAENLPVLGYPNPLAPSHYVVLNTGLTISDQDYNADYAMPRFGDIAVLKIKDASEPPEIVWGGLFDEAWQLPKMSAAAAPASKEYWPGEKWRTAEPESQGLDSSAISAALDQVMQKRLGVHSVLVIRHGYAVAEAYFYPYDPGTPHDLASVTKTMTSTLAGVAAGQGLIRLDQKLLSFFPNERPGDADERKQKITVGNVLHMESGLDCGYLPGEQELEGMKRSANWVKYALALPMKYAPGTHSSYCSPGYHLLGSMIGAAAHETELEFARKNLFEPLGIRGVIWSDDPQGRSHGWGDSHLFPQDLAKIGYLYLHGGQWKGKQIVPRDWVEMSIAPAVAQRGEPGGLGAEWNSTDGPNGRQYGGTGRGGQSLIVWPDLDMIVVITAGGNAGQIAPLLRQAAKSGERIAANPEGVRQLHAKITEAAKDPAPAATAPLPAIARTISGHTFEFPVNPSRLDALSLTFQGQSEARVDVKYYGQPLSFPVGLDGVYRLGPNGPLHLLAGAMGKWTSENEFLLDLNFVANINHYTLNIRFEGDRIDVTANEASGLIRNGHLTGTAATR